MKWIKFTKDEINFLNTVIPENDTVGKKLLKKINRNPIKVSSRKAKGRELQKFVCSEIADICDVKYDQSDDDCLIHSREMGQSGVDVILRGFVKDEIDIAFECKNSENLNLRGTIRQAEKNKGEYKNWAIVHKNKELKEPIVIITWSHFKQLLNDLLYYKEFDFTV